MKYFDLGMGNHLAGNFSTFRLRGQVKFLKNQSMTGCLKVQFSSIDIGI